ncbi:hypothetical protein [Bacteroides thetaiotaomicron]|jgi:hypothetical protein
MKSHIEQRTLFSDHPMALWKMAQTERETDLSSELLSDEENI